MHPEIKELIGRLDPVFERELLKAIDGIRHKIVAKAIDYDNQIPVWMKLTKSSDFQAIIKIKTERVISELENVTLDRKHNWDPDNAIDLAVYTLFLIAYSSFVYCPDPQKIIVGTK